MTDPSGEPAPGNPQQVRSSHIGALVPAHVARGTFSTGVAVLQGNHEFIVDFLLQMQQPQQVAARVVLPPAVVGQFLQALGENIKKYEDRFGPIPRPGAAVTPAGSADASAAGELAGDAAPAVDPPAASAPSATPAAGGAGTGSEGPVVGATPGEPTPTPPGPTSASQHAAEDLYDQLRLSEEVMTGQYANAVMIGHSGSEFSFDFIATFYPRSVVVQRVFLAAPNVPRLRDSLAQSFDQFRRRSG